MSAGRNNAITWTSRTQQRDWGVGGGLASASAARSLVCWRADGNDLFDQIMSTLILIHTGSDSASKTMTTKSKHRKTNRQRVTRGDFVHTHTHTHTVEMKVTEGLTCRSCNPTTDVCNVNGQLRDLKAWLSMTRIQCVQKRGFIVSDRGSCHFHAQRPCCVVTHALASICVPMGSKRDVLGWIVAALRSWSSRKISYNKKMCPKSVALSVPAI